MLCTCDEDRVLPRAVTLLRITFSFTHSNSNRPPPRPCAMCNTDNQQMRELNGLVQLRGQGRWALCGEGRPGEVQHTKGIRASPDGQSEASCGLSQQPHAARLPVGLRRHPAVVGSVRRHCHCVVFFLTFFLYLKCVLIIATTTIKRSHFHCSVYRVALNRNITFRHYIVRMAPPSFPLLYHVQYVARSPEFTSAAPASVT